MFIVGREECDQFNENRKLLVIVTLTGRSRAQPDRRGGILVNSAVCMSTEVSKGIYPTQVHTCVSTRPSAHTRVRPTASGWRRRQGELARRGKLGSHWVLGEG